jgi:anti-anti-sigma regulatory factor
MSPNRHGSATPLPGGGHHHGPVPDPQTPTVRVRRTAEGVESVVTVDGPLDVDSGAELIAEVRAAVAAGSTRLEIDLQSIDSFDAAGAAALAECREAAGTIEGGLHYRTCSGGAGQDALLQAYATES